MTQTVQIQNPKEQRSFRQVKAIFAIGKSLNYSDEKIRALQDKAKTKGQASAIIKALQKAQAKQS